jgi:hypothetical protein
VNANNSHFPTKQANNNTFISGGDSLFKSSIGFKQFKVNKEVEEIEKWLDLQEIKHEEMI